MLQLEFLPSGCTDCPLLRISGDDPSACTQLMVAFQSLASGRSERICINDLPGIESVGGCRLTAVISNQNRGVVQVGDSKAFKWAMTAAAWENNAGLIEPFATQHRMQSYQWLDSPGEIAVVLSPSGQW